MAELAAVSWRSLKACEGVGFWDGGIFADMWTGRIWKVGIIANPRGSLTSYLTAMSCSSARTAVGQYHTEDANLPLAQRWNGTTWRRQPLPVLPKLTDTNLQVIGVSSLTSRHSNPP